MDLQKALEFGNRGLGVHRLGGDALDAVNSRTAAQGHDGFAAVLLVDLVAQLHIVGGGIGMVETLDRIPDSGGVHAVQHGLDHTPAHHAGASDHQHIIDSLFLQELTQNLDFAGSLHVLGHAVAHEIVADLQHRLEAAAPDHFHLMRNRVCHKHFLLILRRRAAARSPGRRLSVLSSFYRARR